MQGPEIGNFVASAAPQPGGMRASTSLHHLQDAPNGAVGSIMRISSGPLENMMLTPQDDGYLLVRLPSSAVLPLLNVLLCPCLCDLDYCSPIHANLLRIRVLEGLGLSYIEQLVYMLRQ